MYLFLKEVEPDRLSTSSMHTDEAHAQNYLTICEQPFPSHFIMRKRGIIAGWCLLSVKTNIQGSLLGPQDNGGYHCLLASCLYQRYYRQLVSKCRPRVAALIFHIISQDPNYGQPFFEIVIGARPESTLVSSAAPEDETHDPRHYNRKHHEFTFA